MNRQFVLLILISFSSVIIACDEPSEIRTYKVPKLRSDLGDIGIARQPVSTRIVVAIAERDDATWFFKLTGNADAVKMSEPDWKRLLQDISFGDDGNPKWESPEGWELGPAKQFRFATLNKSVGGVGNVELAISSLGPNQDLLSNVNRWRRQLNLSSIENEELKLDEMKSSFGTLQIFEETGMMGDSAAMMATPKPQPVESDLIYDVPDGWAEGRPNSIVKVRLKKGNSETAPQITVTQLLADANEWIPNAQRWARQVDMDDSEKFAEKKTTKVEIDGLPGKKIRFVPDEDMGKFAMIGTMVVREDLAWFFKVIGNRQDIIDSEGEFDEFVNSFRFE